MKLSATLLAAVIEVDGANTRGGNLSMVRNRQDVGLEGCIGLKAGAVDGNVNIGSGTEDPVVAWGTSFTWFAGVGTPGEAQSTVARLSITIGLALEETGRIRGGGSDSWR